MAGGSLDLAGAHLVEDGSAGVTLWHGGVDFLFGTGAAAAIASRVGSGCNPIHAHGGPEWAFGFLLPPIGKECWRGSPERCSFLAWLWLWESGAEAAKLLRRSTRCGGISGRCITCRMWT